MNFFSVEQDGKVGVQCELCGDRFFDQMAATRVLVSCMDKAISHGRNDHRQHPPGRIAMGEPEPAPAPGKAEQQRSRGLRTVAKPGDFDYAQERTE